MTRFIVVAAIVDKLDSSIILMAIVSGLVSKTNIRVALKGDLPMDLAEYYHEAKRYLNQEDVETEDAKVNVVDDKGLSGVGKEKDR